MDEVLQYISENGKAINTNLLHTIMSMFAVKREGLWRKFRSQGVAPEAAVQDRGKWSA
jgi:hypothetical protein